MPGGRGSSTSLSIVVLTGRSLIRTASGSLPVRTFQRAFPGLIGADHQSAPLLAAGKTGVRPAVFAARMRPLGSDRISPSRRKFHVVPRSFHVARSDDLEDQAGFEFLALKLLFCLELLAFELQVRSSRKETCDKTSDDSCQPADDGDQERVPAAVAATGQRDGHFLLLPSCFRNGKHCTPYERSILFRHSAIFPPFSP